MQRMLMIITRVVLTFSSVVYPVVETDYGLEVVVSSTVSVVVVTGTSVVTV